MNEKGKKTRVLVVEGLSVVRKGLTELINRESDLEVCAEAENANQALELVDKQQIDLAIVDVSPGGRLELQLAEKMKLRHPSLPVLTLSMDDELLYSKHLFQAEAREYVIGRHASEQITTAIHYIQTLLRNRLYGFTVSVKVESSMNDEQGTERISPETSAEQR